MMIQEDTYKTIIGVAEGIYTEKRSCLLYTSDAADE